MFLRKSTGNEYLCEKVTITSEIDIIDLVSYYLVKFNINEDREKAMTRGPWAIQGHYLIVRI